MRELSLHLLDIVENSVKAEATLIKVSITVDREYIRLEIEDDGKGMTEEFLAKVLDPFTTTRTTRKVGLGIPLLKLATAQANGEFDIKSKLGVGTTVKASFERDNIDRMPLGDLAETITTVLYPDVDFVWTYKVMDREFVFDTREIKADLGEVPIDSVDVIVFLNSFLRENIESINGGITI